MFSLLIIILMKNHNLSLALDNQTVKLLSIWLINWTSPVYSCEHVGYSNAGFYSTTVSMLTILQCQLSLSSWACQLFSSISLFSHAQFSLIQIFFDLNFFTHFSVVFLFNWSYSCIWDYDQIYCHKQLFYFKSCFVEKFLVCSNSQYVLSSCWDFSQAHYYELLFNFMQHSWKRFFVCIFKFQKCKFL